MTPMPHRSGACSTNDRNWSLIEVHKCPLRSPTTGGNGSTAGIAAIRRSGRCSAHCGHPAGEGRVSAEEPPLIGARPTTGYGHNRTVGAAVKIIP